MALTVRAIFIHEVFVPKHGRKWDGTALPASWLRAVVVVLQGLYPLPLAISEHNMIYSGGAAFPQITRPEVKGYEHAKNPRNA